MDLQKPYFCGLDKRTDNPIQHYIDNHGDGWYLYKDKSVQFRLQNGMTGKVFSSNDLYNLPNYVKIHFGIDFIKNCKESFEKLNLKNSLHSTWDSNEYIYYNKKIGLFQQFLNDAFTQIIPEKIKADIVRSFLPDHTDQITSTKPKIRYMDRYGYLWYFDRKGQLFTKHEEGKNDYTTYAVDKAPYYVRKYFNVTTTQEDALVEKPYIHSSYGQKKKNQEDQNNRDYSLIDLKMLEIYRGKIIPELPELPIIENWDAFVIAHIKEPMIERYWQQKFDKITNADQVSEMFKNLMPKQSQLQFIGYLLNKEKENPNNLLYIHLLMITLDKNPSLMDDLTRNKYFTGLKDFASWCHSKITGLQNLIQYKDAANLLNEYYKIFVNAYTY